MTKFHLLPVEAGRVFINYLICKVQRSCNWQDTGIHLFQNWHQNWVALGSERTFFRIGIKQQYVQELPDK